MAATAIPFVVSKVTPADRLLEMLETVTTLRDFSVWARDYLDHTNLLSVDDQHNLTRIAVSHRAGNQGGRVMDRRSLITSGIATAVAVGVAPAALASQAQAQTDEWASALREWKALKAEYNRHPYGSCLPGHPNHDVWEAEAADIGERESTALFRLLEMPAPDMRALLQKLKILQREIGGHHMNAIIRDVARFA